MIEVTKKGPEIEGLKQGLEDSMPWFIHECVEALSQMYARGGEIDSPRSKELVHELHRESDSVQAFLDDCIERKAGERIERGRLYRKYDDYCRDNDWTSLSNRNFYRNLRGKGYTERKIRGIRYILNMCPISAPHGADFRPATQGEMSVFSKNKG